MLENHIELTIEILYSLSQTIAGDLLKDYTYPWEVLPDIRDIILKVGNKLESSEYLRKGDNVWIHKSALVFDTAHISGPTIIGANSEIRHGAFIRGNALVGDNCVVGNSTELKNVILFNNVQVPHYNYVGDSILGYKSHMGAGSVTSNVKSDKTLVQVKGDYYGDKFQINTKLKKFGAMLGDFVEVGCNSVLNPGTVVGRNTNIYPLSMVRGYVPSGSIYKNKDNVERKL